MRIFLSAFAIGLALLASTTAFAGEEAAQLERLIGTETAVIDSVTESSPAIVTNPNILRLTPDRTQIIHLQENATSVIVTNPAHAEVALDTPRTLVVMPRMPGATSFKVLNTRGDIILERDVIITGASQQYVRVRRVCNGQDPTCLPYSYFYCPDGCYAVATVPPSDGGSTAPAIAGNTAGGFVNQPVNSAVNNQPAIVEDEEDGEEPEGDDNTDPPAEEEEPAP